MDKIIEEHFESHKQKALEAVALHIVRDLENIQFRVGAPACIFTTEEENTGRLVFHIEQNGHHNRVAYPVDHFKVLPKPFDKHSVLKCVSDLWKTVEPSPQYELTNWLAQKSKDNYFQIKIDWYTDEPIDGLVKILNPGTHSEIGVMDVNEWMEKSSRFFEKFVCAYGRTRAQTDQETDQEPPSKVSKHN